MTNILADVCPYCGSAYGIQYGGCASECARMAEQNRLAREAAEADVHEYDETDDALGREP